MQIATACLMNVRKLIPGFDGAFAHSSKFVSILFLLSKFKMKTLVILQSSWNNKI